MTKPLVGNVMKRIADDTGETCRVNERLFATVIDDLLDGDDDTTQAQRGINLLRTRNIELFAIQMHIRNEQMEQAETAAMRLAASLKEPRQ